MPLTLNTQHKRADRVGLLNRKQTTTLENDDDSLNELSWVGDCEGGCVHT